MLRTLIVKFKRTGAVTDDKVDMKANKRLQKRRKHHHCQNNNGTKAINIMWTLGSRRRSHSMKDNPQRI